MVLVKDVIWRYQYLLFALVGAIVILWQMLVQGYVLTLDLVFGPAHHFPSLNGSFLNGLPVQLFVYSLQFVLPSWVIEKIFLFGLFFCLLYFPLRCIPIAIDPRARYAGALLFTVNPFVYERMLAGQWLFLYACAFLWPFLYFFFMLARSPERRYAYGVAASALVVGMCSLHVFLMCAILSVGIVIVQLAQPGQQFARLLKYVAFATLLIVVGSSYWILPAALAPAGSAPTSQFDARDNAAFAPSGDEVLGTMGNIAVLYGMWTESYPIRDQFISPKELVTFWPGFVLLFLCIVIGGIALVRSSEKRIGFIVVGMGFFAFIFSLGVAPTPLQGLNQWLFDYVPLWSGFRDSEKWSVVLLYLYSMFLAFGVHTILSRACSETPPPRSFLGRKLFDPPAGGEFFRNKKLLGGGDPGFQTYSRQRTRVLAALFFIAPILYTPLMLFGFAGQLHAVSYPPSWQRANELISKSPDCRALFLPWYQYYAPSWNNGIIVANPAPAFFDCTMYTSQNAEIGGIVSSGERDALYRQLEKGITATSSTDTEAFVTFLKKDGIRYIVYDRSRAGSASPAYPFLHEVHISQLASGGVDNSFIEVSEIK